MAYPSSSAALINSLILFMFWLEHSGLLQANIEKSKIPQTGPVLAGSHSGTHCSKLTASLVYEMF